MGVAEREDVLDTEPVEGSETIEEEIPEGEEAGDGESAEGAESPDDVTGEQETVVSFGSEEPPASEEEKAAPKWVKELRERQKTLARENAELKAKLGTPSAPAKPALPPKPKLADYDYDEERFDAATDDWHAKKRDVDSWEANQKAAAEAQQKRVQAVHEQYVASAKALGVKDYQVAEDEVAAVLDDTAQALIKLGAKNPGALVYALGMNPKKLQELASIKDPVKFAFAAGRLETEVKVTKRAGSNKPAPETGVRGGGGTPGTQSKATLERLEAEAAKSGDRSKVIAYKRQLAKGK